MPGKHNHNDTSGDGDSASASKRQKNTNNDPNPIPFYDDFMAEFTEIPLKGNLHAYGKNLVQYIEEKYEPIRQIGEKIKLEREGDRYDLLNADIGKRLEYTKNQVVEWKDRKDIAGATADKMQHLLEKLDGLLAMLRERKKPIQDVIKQLGGDLDKIRACEDDVEANTDATKKKNHPNKTALYKATSRFRKHMQTYQSVLKKGSADPELKARIQEFEVSEYLQRSLDEMPSPFPADRIAQLTERMAGKFQEIYLFRCQILVEDDVEEIMLALKVITYAKERIRASKKMLSKVCADNNVSLEDLLPPFHKAGFTVDDFKQVEAAVLRISKGKSRERTGKEGAELSKATQFKIFCDQLKSDDPQMMEPLLTKAKEYIKTKASGISAGAVQEAGAIQEFGDGVEDAEPIPVVEDILNNAELMAWFEDENPMF